VGLPNLFSQNTTECFNTLAIPVFAPLADGATLFGLVEASETGFVDFRWDVGALDFEDRTV
jgi:hypothetical protein